MLCPYTAFRLYLYQARSGSRGIYQLIFQGDCRVPSVEYNVSVHYSTNPTK